MNLQESGFSSGYEGRVVRFVPPAQFKQEASDLMTTMANHLQKLEQMGGDPILTNYVSRSMGDFYKKAALRGLNDIADLAWHVARALEQAEPGSHKTAKHVLYLSLAAVSQIQCLLNPSVEKAGVNARRLVKGLLTKW